MLIERLGGRVSMVEGLPQNLKITTPDDLKAARAWVGGRAKGMSATRSGLGFDLHPLVDGRPLVLGGISRARTSGDSAAIRTPTS